jgi:hypothetical protein
MNVARLGLAVMAAVALAGCGNRPSPDQTETALYAQALAIGACPMVVLDTKVTASNVEGGLTLDFRTTTDHVAELRDAVRKMVGGPVADTPVTLLLGNGSVLATRAPEAEDIERGERVTLYPADPLNLTQFRVGIKTQADRMAYGECTLLARP